MSAMEKQVVEVQEKLDDITECPICTETYKEPKILPCIHTFCMTCLQETGLKTEKNAGGRMPCPICRTEFTVPEIGFGGLQRNFFMERLIEMKNILNPSSKRVLCDACEEDNDLGAEAEIPPAEMYCVECRQRLCEDCCKNHRKSKASKHHRFLSLDDVWNSIQSIDKSYVCDDHDKRPLEIYCSTCHEVVCALCLYKSHKTHDTSPVIDVIADFRKIIQDNADGMKSFVLDLERIVAGTDNDKDVFVQRMTDVETEIKRIEQNLQERTKQNCESLLQDLKSLKEERMKENECRLSDIEDVVASLKSYEAYCTHVASIGSDVDICRAAHDLITRSTELKQRYQSMSLEPFPSIFLRKSEYHGALCQTDCNIIGEIKESGEDYDKAEDSTNQESSDSTCDATKEELTKKVRELEQELESMKQKEMARERAEKSFRKYKPTPQNIKGINTKMATSGCVTVTGITIMHDELFISTGKSSYIDVYNSTTYACKRLLCVSGLSDPWDMCSCSSRKCLYIATGYINDDQMRFKVNSAIRIEELHQRICGPNAPKILVVDKVGCLKHSWEIGDDFGTLSITDKGNVILTVPVRSKIVEYDSDGNCLREINISTDLNLAQILSSTKTQTGYTYAICPRQCEKMSNGNFLTNYFIFEKYSDKSPLNYRTVTDYYNKKGDGLCIINDHGEVISALPGNDGSGFGQLYTPWNFVVDKEMVVSVLDKSNRISLLYPNLEYKRELVSKENRLSNRYKMCLDEANGRLLVANIETQDDHVSVFKIMQPCSNTLNRIR